jgi:hypothetical protein
MKKLIVVWLLCCLPLFSFADDNITIGGDNSFNKNQGISQGQIKSVSSEAGGGRTHLKEWTVIMYWDGDDNDIQTDLINAFRDMAISKVGSTDQVNMVLQFDRYPGNSAYGGWSITHRFFLTPGMEPTEANAIADWGDKQGGGREVDMSDPDVLRDFIEWAVRNYPAKRYALIVADHGFGWEGLAIDNTNYQRTMSIKQLRQAIEESHVPFDLLSLDACLMQMIEVARELWHAGIDILVGSEARGRTWPYAEILQSIMQKPGMSAEEIGETIVDCYIGSHPEYTDVTLSVMKVRRVKALTAVVKELSLGILNDYPFQEVKDRAAAVMEGINSTVIYKKNALDWESAGGISVYFPEAYPMAAVPPELLYFYKSQIVSFAEDALWHDLLTSCYVWNPEPGPHIQMLINIRKTMKPFDPDKVDLYDLCNSIMNYPAP